MYTVGLTGPIGSGKSTLAGLLKEKGAIIIDADAIGHQLLKESDIKKQLEQAFGQSVFTDDDEIDRQKLSQAVFDNKKQLQKLNQIMWPPIYKIIEEELQSLSRDLPANTIVVIEAPFIKEAGLNKLLSKIIAVISDPAIQLERLKAKGYSKDQAQKRMAVQTSQEELIKQSDYIVTNNNGVEVLENEAEKLWHFIKKQSA